jgi:hypothetical protein
MPRIVHTENVIPTTTHARGGGRGGASRLRASPRRLLRGLADDLREGYPLIAVDPRPWVASRPTWVVDVLWSGG